MTDDTVLLRRYLVDRSEPAFAELVQRHVNLVYFTALRRLQGAAPLAEDVAQTVFLRLARKAPALTEHPALTGWLYTATLNASREAARAEMRRHRRETEAHAMDQALRPATPEPDWDEVRPVIDDALGDLDAPDRDAVLLRFFENRRYADIASLLRTTENTARMRVERALDKLRAALGRRGVTSSAAALSTALTVPAGAAAPAALAPAIVNTVLAGGTALAGGSATAALLSMTTSVKLTLAATGLAAVALGVAVHQGRQLASARAEVAALNAQTARQQTLIDNLEWRLAAAHERRALDGSGVAPAGGSPATLAAPANPITRDQVESRLAKAQKLAAAGRHAEALQEYLWCYDVGMRQVEGYFLLRYSAVLDALGALGRSYPPALDALRERRNAARERLMTSHTDLEAGKDYAHINRALGEQDLTFALFDSLAEDDPRRGHLIEVNMARLLSAQRYREFAKAMPYATLPQVWEQMTAAALSPAVTETARSGVQRHAIRFAADQIEVRAGAGDTVSASDMIERLLIFDNSPATVEIIKQRLQRAGRPELFAGP